MPVTGLLSGVLLGHGNPDYGNVLLCPQRAEEESLSNFEMVAAHSVLPPNVRLSVVNEACYSSTWVTMAPDLAKQPKCKKIGKLFEHLAQKGLITDIPTKEVADQVLADHTEGVVFFIAEGLVENSLF
jgi:hypothetical protein